MNKTNKQNKTQPNVLFECNNFGFCDQPYKAQFHIAFFPEDELGIVHSTIKLYHPI